MAVYNCTISYINGDGDMERFYEVVLPFLTGRPLETILVESEKLAEANGADGVLTTGDWRSPQKAETAFVRCIISGIQYLLRRKGGTVLEAKQLHLALRMQLTLMVINDMTHVVPDENGLRICSMVA